MPDTQVVSNIAEQTITIERVFDAPREVVWKAWTRPAQFAGWAGCDGHSVPRPTITMDVRPGGDFRFTMVNDSTRQEYPSRATYREVVEPERLVWAVHDSRLGPREVVVTLTLTDLGDGRTKMHFQQAGFSWGAYEAGLRATRAGLAEEIDRLVHYLQRVRVTSSTQ
jgi:uncharacterized protein YndB with AHSA1/START domain